MMGSAPAAIGWDTGNVVFVADDLAAWLIGVLADAWRKKLTTMVLGTEQERALRSAATAAVQRTADELRPGDEEQAAQLAMVISHFFGEPVPGVPLAENATVLEALQREIVRQLAALDDASLTGTGQSSAEVLGLPATVVADKLTSHLVREIVVRGTHGGALTPLASQLNHDVTHLQGQRLEAMFARVGDEIMAALAQPNRVATGLPAPELVEAPGKCRGWIDSPNDGDTVGTRIAVHGGVRDVPHGHHLWIVHRVDPGGLLWPKDVEITPDQNGHFDVYVYEGGSSPRLYLALILVPATVSADFDRWINEGSRTGHYPGLRLSPDSYIELARVSLRHDPGQG